MALQEVGAVAVLKGVRGFLGGMKKMGRSMTNFAGTALKMGAIAGGAAVAGIAAMGVALGKLAIDAAPLEGIGAAFEGITADIEGGSKAMLKALQDASLGMVTNRDLMMSFNLAAQLVGKDFAQNLPDAMQFLGKVAAATGQDMGFMMDSLVRGVGRLSPMILDNLGIQVDLTQAYEDWAKINKTTVDKMSKTEQQAAVMAQVMAKLEENTASMPEVMGTASQQIAAFKTTLANTKDEIGLALLPILKSLLGKLQEFATNVLPLVIEWVENRLVPALAMIGDWIMQNVIPAISAVVGWVRDKLVPALAMIGDWIMQNVVPAIATVARWFQDNLPSAIATTTDFFEGTLRPALEDAGAWIQDNLIPAISTIITWLQTNLPPAIEAASKWFREELIPALTEVWNYIKTNIIPLFVAVARVLGATIGKAVEFLAALWSTTLLPALQDVWGFIKNNLRPVFDRIAKIIQKVIKWLEKLAKTISSIELPDWLKRESPSPFEMTFIGAGAAIKKLATQELPRLSASLQMAQVPALAPVSQQTSIDNRQVNIGNVNNNNQIDAHVFDQSMRQWLG